jgi:hypothetical protein
VNRSLSRPETKELVRCDWARNDLAIAYHDREWGVPQHDNRVLFEFLILDGAQAGLSWDTILRKRENYRDVFDNFDPKNDLIIGRGGRKLHQVCYRRWPRGVQSAFGFAEARPAPGASVLPRLHRASAMCASDAGIVEIVKGIVGDLVLERVVPNHLARPIGQRANLDQVELGVPVYLEHPSTFASLITANGCHPGIEGR